LFASTFVSHDLSSSREIADPLSGQPYVVAHPRAGTRGRPLRPHIDHKMTEFVDRQFVARIN
jgi:hypothetical protein